MINNNKIKKIQSILNYKFKNLDNLKNCLTHPSTFRNINNRDDNYAYEFERLEFLGDRVLGLIVASLIFNKFKNYNEGRLSKKFSYLVQSDFLYKIATEINLENFLLFNKQNKTSLKSIKSILADSLESLVGAIYIDGGYLKSYYFIKKFWSPHLDKIISDEIDPKSKLQEISQKIYKKLPEYTLIKKEGLSHSPKFTISLNALNFKNIQTKGSSIQEAQKKAAIKILSLLNEK
tara:strand:- start:649 stop:1350 length:702 start_codon:yes stop_codon:yes gene_type:complete